jgi:hypothetical protein
MNLQTVKPRARQSLQSGHWIVSVPADTCDRLLKRGFSPLFVIAETLDAALNMLHWNLLQDQCGML